MQSFLSIVFQFHTFWTNGGTLDGIELQHLVRVITHEKTFQTNFGKEIHRKNAEKLSGRKKWFQREYDFHFLVTSIKLLKQFSEMEWNCSCCCMQYSIIPSHIQICCIQMARGLFNVFFHLSARLYISQSGAESVEYTHRQIAAFMDVSPFWHP